VKIFQKIGSIVPGNKSKKGEKRDRKLVADLESSLDYPANENADVLLSYARDNFAEMKTSAERIEKKADELIKYLGIGTAFWGYVVTNSLGRMAGYGNQWILFVALATWILSLAFAIVVKWPAPYLYPDGLYRVYEQIAKKGADANSAKTILLLSYERARISHYYQGRRKAGILNGAYAFLIVSLGCISSFLLSILF